MQRVKLAVEILDRTSYNWKTVISLMKYSLIKMMLMIEFTVFSIFKTSFSFLRERLRNNLVV